MAGPREERFWAAWSDFVVRWPRLVLSVCSVTCVVFALVAATAPRDLSLVGLLGEDDPDLLAVGEVDKTFGSNSLTILLLEGEPDAVDSAVDALAIGLAERVPQVKVVLPADPQWLIDRSPWLWPDLLFTPVANAVKTGQAPPGLLSQLEQVDQLIRDQVEPTDRAAIVSFEFQAGAFDLVGQAADLGLGVIPAVEDIMADLETPVTFRFTGATFIGMENGDRLFTRLSIITPFTLVCVMLLMFWIEPRLSRVLIAGIGLGGSVAVAVGVVALVNGQISIMASVFAMILLGLGVDFSIHLLVGLREARADGLSPEDSVRRAIDQSGTPIVLGGVSTSLAFFVLLSVPDQGARDVGLTAIAGLAASLLLMLTFLPAGWLLVERRRGAEGKTAKLNLPGLHELVGFSMRFPKTMIAIGVVLAIVGLAGVPRYRLESDFNNLVSHDLPSLEVVDRLEELYGVAMTPLIAPVDSIEQAEEWASALRDSEVYPDVEQVRTITDLLGKDDTARQAAMEAALAATDAESPLRARLVRALEAGPIAIETLPPVLRGGLVGKNGELAIQILPKNDLSDAHEIGEYIDRIREVAPTATGIPVINRVATLGQRDFVPIIVPSIFIGVTLVLMLSFRNWRDVMFALLPVTVGTAITFGTCFWFGLQFDRLTGFIVPVILGLGVDDGIHVVERLRRYRVRTHQTIHTAVASVGKPIFLTTATTVISFTGLLFTNHIPFEALAKFMLIGMPACFLASIMIIPGAALLVERRNETESDRLLAAAGLPPR